MSSARKIEEFWSQMDRSNETWQLEARPSMRSAMLRERAEAARVEEERRATRKTSILKQLGLACIDESREWLEVCRSAVPRIVAAAFIGVAGGLLVVVAVARAI